MPEPILSDKSGPAEKHKLHGLDHLRAFAIIYVVLFHYQFFGHPAWVNKIAGFGWTGVDLFFVLSGYLIAGQLFSEVVTNGAISIWEFFIKRFFRIIPPFLLVVALYFTFPALREWGHPSPLWRYLTFTLNYGLDLRKYGTFSHAWSLCVEEQFYVILPFTFWLFNHYQSGKKSVYLVAALFLGGFVIRYLNWQYFAAPQINSDNFGAIFNEYIYYPTYNRLDGLLTGVSIAGLFTFYPQIKELANRYNYLLLLGGVMMLVAGYLIGTPQTTFRNTIFGYPVIALAYGLILAAVVSPSNILYRLKSKITANIAAFSYAIYLTHKIVIHVVQKQLGTSGIDVNTNSSMLICAFAVLAVALLIRYAVEKPVLLMRNRLLKQAYQHKN